MSRPHGSKNIGKRERLFKVEAMMLAHHTDAQVVQASIQEWGIHHATAKAYVREVRERWHAETVQERAAEKKEAIQRLKQIARRNQDKPSVLLKVEEQLAKILGTHEPEERRVEVIDTRTVFENQNRKAAALLGLDEADL